MNHLEDISQNVGFRPKRDEFGQKKGPKRDWLDFSQTVNLNFFKEDHNIGFYTNKYA